MLLFGCQGAKYLKENQKLLHRQSVKGPKGFDTSPMTNLYTQEANRKLLGQLPIYTLVWLYYVGYESFNNPESHGLFKSKAKLEKIKAKKEKNPTSAWFGVPGVF